MDAPPERGLIWDAKTGRLVAQSSPPPASSGADIPKFLGGSSGSSSREKSRSDREIYNAFQAALKAEGLTPTSGFRTFEQQAALYRRLGKGNAAPPGTSDHEFYKAFDFDPNVDREALARAAAKAGVRLGPELVHGKKRHLHQTFEDAGKRGGGGEAEVARAAEEAERKRKDALREEFRQQSDLREANVSILRAQQELANDYVDRNLIAVRLVDLDLEQEQAAIALSVALGERTEADARILAAKADELAVLKKQAIAKQEQVDRRATYERLEKVDEDLKRELLEGERDLAETSSERRAVELRLLDLAYEEERKRLQRILDESESWEEQEEARRQLATLPKRRENDEERARRGTMGPLEEFLRTIPQSAAEVNEALELIAANGLNSLTDGITDAIMGAKSLGDVFKEVSRQIIASLIRIAVQRAIIAPLANSLFGTGAPPPIGGAAGAGGAIGGLLAGLGKLFRGGRANGGAVSPGGWYMVGERGPEPFFPSVPGTIMPNHVARGAGGGDVIRVHIDKSQYFDARVERISGRSIVSAAPALISAGGQVGHARAAIENERTLP
jgi:hypothetical protein